ncbi:UNVERIFIED_CONTAM: hypothetical protein Sangu_2106500 [Sesamum angustifolium]|uniref:Uncharacterized protein n=1 Tax=Sesamum angustifolium TaxID=2727405 RepID=A0AAW2LKL7_9LAMI
MRAKVVVFPIRGRSWCFSRSIDPSLLAPQSSNTPSTLKDLFSKIFSSSQHGKASSEDSKVELAVDFVANKMNGAWSNLEKAPQGTFKNKIHGLNPRLVRRRLRHIAFRGSIIHKKYFYGSAVMLPLTSVFMFLPLPNVPFFWILFRTYSHWRASQGSEKLLHLVSDASSRLEQSTMAKDGKVSLPNSDKGSDHSTSSPLVFQPSEELQKLLHYKDGEDGLSECAILKICKIFYLNSTDVVKYRHSI